MRVWIIDDKAWSDYPASRWSCEWFELRPDAGEDADPIDDTVCNVRSFGAKGHGLAVHYAEKIASKRDYFGCARVFRERLEIVEGNSATWAEDKSSVEEVTPA